MSKISKVSSKLKKYAAEKERQWKNLPPKKVGNILVIRFSSMGDIVLTSAVVRAIRQQYPVARIVFLTKEEYALIPEASPYIDDVVTLKSSAAVTLDSLHKYDFDIIVDLHKNIRSKRIRRGLPKAQYYTFDKLNFKKWLLVNFKINLLPEKSIVDRYFDGMVKLDLKYDGKGLDYFIPSDSKISAGKDLPMSHQAGYVVGVIGGTYETKKMPPEKWEELCKNIKYPIILVGGEEDNVLGNHLETFSADRKVYNACGKFSLHESADIVSRSMAVISHDTGMMHIAAAFSKPIITLWGNTVKRFGMFPYLPEGAPKYLDSEVEISCRPCSKLGHAKCPKKHFKCMKEQNISLILKDLEKCLLLANH